MRVEQEKVRLFHEKYEFPAPETPESADHQLRSNRYDLMREELDEYLDAEGDLTGIADALADLLYVVLGTAVAHGIELQPIFDEVHRSNMTKDVERQPGKPLKPTKGATFQHPRIPELLLLQMWKPTEPLGVQVEHA
jgi:predicted HAD superfamily Cof-like phosphohydrolase